MSVLVANRPPVQQAMGAQSQLQQLRAMASPTTTNGSAVSTASPFVASTPAPASTVASILGSSPTRDAENRRILGLGSSRGNESSSEGGGEQTDGSHLSANTTRRIVIRSNGRASTSSRGASSVAQSRNFQSTAKAFADMAHVSFGKKS